MTSPFDAPPRRLNWSHFAQAAIKLGGLAGFLGLLAAANGSAHADLLRKGSIAWFIGFGLLNAGVVLWRAAKGEDDRRR